MKLLSTLGIAATQHGWQWRLRTPPAATLCLLAAGWLLLLVNDARAYPRPRPNSKLPTTPMTTAATTTTLSAQVAAVITVPTDPELGVVVDWQSVCKHLCGSGLGGSGCGSGCYRSAGYAAQNDWIDNRFLVGCPLMCSVRLGDSRCNCPAILSDDLYYADPAEQNAICALGCTTGNPLNGCSECVVSRPELAIDSGTDRPAQNPTASRPEQPTDALADGNSTTPLNPGADTTTDSPTVATVVTETVVPTAEFSDATELTSAPAEPASSMATVDGKEEEGKETATTAVPTTAVPTTTAVATTTKKPVITTTTKKPSTTPDWTEVCHNLCRIGEGGALCNCDLPPFML